MLNETTNRGRRRRRLSTVGLLVLLALAAALSLSLVDGRGSAATSGSSAADEALLGSVLQGMSTNLVAVSLGAPPLQVSNTGTSTWLDVTHAAGQNTAENVEDAWYASLIAGGYGAQCASQGADCLAGFTFESADGPQEDDLASRLVIQPVTMTSASPSELSSTIEERLAGEGIAASSVTYLHPYGPAAIVEVESSDPQAVVTDLNAGSVFAGLGLDGYLVQVDDLSGNVAYVEDMASRAGAGGGWAAPYLKVSNLP